MQDFKKYVNSAIYPDAWTKWTRLKKIHCFFEWWCTSMYTNSCRISSHPKLSPSGARWVLYQLPWYAKYISKIEFQLRYLVYPKPECIKGFFPFYRRK